MAQTKTIWLKALGTAAQPFAGQVARRAPRSTHRGSLPAAAQRHQERRSARHIGREIDVPPGYWIVPEWWMLNHIYVRYHEGLAQHGGARPKNPDSTHFAIIPKNVEQWRDRWDRLGIFEEPSITS